MAGRGGGTARTVGEFCIVTEKEGEGIIIINNININNVMCVWFCLGTFFNF